ncbi:hypothetical protein [Gelria sp. Kuro-4]|uniref:hypothetical protein n=1 Tax=Gelria sp. Kuro-4 TaxID=2796927 RepID=UPI001BEF6AAA|nr:hypothetical protein [Gelria sp. Kuro-4]BCV23316.1 hypothetical protein kuro4_00890 [Gelria sp. Kuro-4]
MPERDWQKDWELCEKADPEPWYAEVYAQRVMPYICEHATPGNVRFIAEARSALPYWLQRVRELEVKWLAETEEKIRLRYTKTQLEEENAKLRQRVRKLEAQVAAMREALEGLMYSDGHFRGECSAFRCHPTCEKARKALAALEEEGTNHG